MTKEYIDKEARIAAQAEFEKWQAKYNETGDISILWDHLEPLFRNAAGPNILKINKNHYVKNFDDKVDNAVLLIMGRYTKNPKYNFGSLVTLMYWAAVSVCHNKNTVAEEMTSFYSYEDLLEKGMHDEHVLSTEIGDIAQSWAEMNEEEEIKEDETRPGENRPTSELHYYTVRKRGKDGKWTITHTPIGARKATSWHRYKCVLRTRRCESEER